VRSRGKLFEIADAETARFARATEAGTEESAPAGEPVKDDRGEADEPPAVLPQAPQQTSA